MPDYQKLAELQSLGQFNSVTRAEFEALRREVQEMKELLKAAKKEDQRAGTPDCEMADKLIVLRKVAELVGVNIDELSAG